MKWCHILGAPPLQSARSEIFEYSPPPLGSKLFFLAAAFSPSTGDRWVWCRWKCGYRTAARALSLRSHSSRKTRRRWTAGQDRSSMLKGCTLETSGRPEPVSMRVLLSVLYPVLSLTIFGLYPTMVSFPVSHSLSPTLFLVSDRGCSLIIAQY